MTVVKYSLTINTVKENIHKNLLFSVNIVRLLNTGFFNPKSFPIFTLQITPQRALFNNEDFHSAKILEAVVRESEVLAHRKKWLSCKITLASIQTFVEGLLRLANILEATNGTLKNVNNTCTLAINSTKYVVQFSGDLTVVR